MSDKKSNISYQSLNGGSNKSKNPSSGSDSFVTKVKNYMINEKFYYPKENNEKTPLIGKSDNKK